MSMKNGDSGASGESETHRPPPHLMGGYDPTEGMSHHGADQPKRNPVPSLLRTLLSEHLDAGYPEAAQARAAGAPIRSRAAEWCWRLGGFVLVALIFGVAVAQTTHVQPGVAQEQQGLLSSVRNEQREAAALGSARDQLTSDVEEARRSQLQGNKQGEELLGRLDDLALAAATTEVHGPALVVTVADPGTGGDLSDVSKERIPRSQQVVLDRDLQLVVNSLWSAGAEAVSVSGVRIGPNVTIRQAGGAILVDNQPTNSPYRVVAIGPANTIEAAFEQSPGMARIRLLQQTYGVQFTMATQENAQMPPAASRNIKYSNVIPAGQ